jgi:hypothetical protein
VQQKDKEREGIPSEAFKQTFKVQEREQNIGNLSKA